MGKSLARVAADVDLEAWAAIDRGDLQSAEEAYRRVLDLRIAVLGSDHPDVALALSNLGWVLQGQKRFEEAETLHRRAIALYRSAFGDDHPAVARSLTSLGACFISERRYSAAEDVLIEALGIYATLPPPPHPHRFVTIQGLVRLYQAWSKPERAAQYRDMLYQATGASDQAP